MIASLIYFMCAATSAACAVLLMRGYRHTRVALLFWSALCFTGFTISNTFLIVDVFLVKQTSLLTLRHLTTLSSLVVLLYGLIWETR